MMGLFCEVVRIMIAMSLRGKVLELAHEGHQVIVNCKPRLRTNT